MANNLVKPADLHKRIIQVVKKYVECQDELVFDYFSNDRSKLALRNKARHFYKDDDENFFLCKVKELKGLYIHIGITYKIPDTKASLTDNTFKFESISLQFWHGTGKAFCRAEWDLKKEKLEHPQPHWHWGEGDGVEEIESQQEKQMFVVNQPVDQQGGFFLEVGVEPEAVIDEKLPNINFEKLHYAIAAKWAERDACVEAFSDAKLITWIKNIIPNVIDQYSYQISKKSFASSKNW